jgi:cytochrome P450/NADPH-cytochrome P450 reductase
VVHRYRLIDSQHYVLQFDSDQSHLAVGFHLDLVRRTREDRRSAVPQLAATATQTPSRTATRVKGGTTLAVLHGSIWVPAGRWPNWSPKRPPTWGAAPRWHR